MELKEKDLYRSAVKRAKEKKDDAISGGFSIVRDLFYKQHKDQQKKKATKNCPECGKADCGCCGKCGKPNCKCTCK